jgi:cyclic 2,3-diphosphoglycerate synthetase
MAGEPFASNVAAGVELANGLNPALILLEGSGAAIPPVASDGRVLVVGAYQPVAHVTGYLGRYRLLTSDAVVVTMAEEPLATPEKVRALVEAIGEVRPGMPAVAVVLRPRPLEDVRGRRVAFFSTASAAQKQVLGEYLEQQWGCRVVMVSTNLADRASLRADLSGTAMAKADMVLTEIKAAAIDVVAEEAQARGLPVVPVDNVPVEADGERPGRLAEVTKECAAMAKERFESRG